MKDLKEKILDKLYKFDLISLIRVLERMGYDLNSIIFKSYDSLGSQSRIVQKVKFKNGSYPYVEVYLNLGLLSPQSPLPDYFRKKADEDIEVSRKYVDFIGFFDHQLLKNFILNVYPELNEHYSPKRYEVKKQYLELLNFKSVHFLHWLFTSTFPELKVEVKKDIFKKKVKTSPTILGKTTIGMGSVIGQQTVVQSDARIITLYSDDETTENNIPWPKEVKDRLVKYIFPILKGKEIMLEIFLVFTTYRSWIKLHSNSYLGYDRIWGKKGNFRRVRIFKGEV